MLRELEREALGEREGSGVALGERECNGEALSVALMLKERKDEGEAEVLVQKRVLALGVVQALSEPLAPTASGLRLRSPDAEAFGERNGEVDRLALAENDTEAVLERLGDGVLEVAGDRDAPLTLLMALIVRMPVTRALCDALRQYKGESEGGEDARGDAEALPETLTERAGEADRGALTESDTEAVLERLGATAVLEVVGDSGEVETDAEVESVLQADGIDEGDCAALTVDVCEIVPQGETD